MVAYDLGMVDRLLEEEYLSMAAAQAKEFDEVYFVRHNPKHDMVEDSVRQGPAGNADLQPLWDQRYKAVIDLLEIPVIEGTCEELLQLF
jgi:hypothetical protein